MVKISFSGCKLGYDVIVVGMGAAAGAFTRYIDEKYSVLVVESMALPRNKPCTGVIVSAAHEFLKENKIVDSVFETPKLLDVTYVDWDNSIEQTSVKGAFNSNRKEFDEWLSKKALSSKNIHVLDRTKFVDFVKVDNSLSRIIIERDGKMLSIICKYLIGADGALSTTRRKMQKVDIPYYIAIKQFALNNGGIKQPLFIFDNSITDYYSWLVPKGRFVEVGVGAKLDNPRAKFELFLTKVHKKFGLVCSGEIQSAVVLRPRSIKDIFLGEGRVLLCGEAAALITPSGAEGISSALLSGKFAAEAINENFDNAIVSYKQKSKVIIKRIQSKFKKASLMGDPQKRKKLFKQI
jgi:geranylgeranyl diphosphate/geranylgeranyl-bacteriochlorophyllide a reductase